MLNTTTKYNPLLNSIDLYYTCDAKYYWYYTGKQVQTECNCYLPKFPEMVQVDQNLIACQQIPSVFG